MASRRIDCIDEAVVEEYVQQRGKFESTFFIVWMARLGEIVT
jgi:hypothetical protein